MGKSLLKSWFYGKPWHLALWWRKPKAVGEDRDIRGKSVDVRHGRDSGGKKVLGISGKKESKARELGELVPGTLSHHVGKTTGVLEDEAALTH